MLQLVRLAALELVEEPEESPPPPQPATATAPVSAMAIRRGRSRFKAAPVYSSATLRRVLSTVVVAAGLMTGLLVQTSGASPTAHASSFAPCNISGKQQQLGASYVTSLKVQGVS